MQSYYGADRPEPVEQGLDLDGFDEDEVKSIIQQELDSALGRDGGTLSGERLQAQKYYQGEPFGNEVEGRSQVVMRSVLEAVEWVLPALIRIFTASDRIGIVEPPPPSPPAPGQPPSPPPELVAQNATEYLTHIFYRDNPGFMILGDWFRDALLEKLGWVKYWWDTQEETRTESYTGLTREMYDAILGDDETVEVVREKSYTQPVDSFYGDLPYPQPMPTTLYDCTLRVTRRFGRVRFDNVAPEEILFSQRAKRGDIPFLAHRRRWTMSDLIQQGYDEDCLGLVTHDDSMEWNTERVERHRDDDGSPFYRFERKDAGKEIWVEESYVRLARGDAPTTELYKVTTAGGGLIILTRDGEPAIEPVDEVPFVSICPIPQSHRLVGMSLADLTMDLQLIKSTLFRQMLDNGYLTNWPRTEVADDVVNENTYDDLLTLRPGGVVRTRRLGGLAPLTIPYTADKSFPILEYLDQTQEVRTGVARHNQGINPDDLNKTATGISLLQQAADQRVELFARIFAHGVEQLLRGIMGLVRKHQQAQRMIRVTGEWIAFDPKDLRDEMPVTVSVGLGTGNRDQVLAHLTTVVGLQAQIVQQQGGLNGPLVYAANVYDALRLLQENAGLKTPLFADPSGPPPPGTAPPGPPPPDPAMLKVQAAMQAQQMKAQADAQAAQGKAQLEMQLGQQKAELEARLAQQRMQHQMELETRKADHEMALERERSQNDIIIERSKAEASAAAQMREIELKYAAGAYAGQPGFNGGGA